MNVRPESEEVLYAADAVVAVAADDIERLKEAAAANPRRRIRLCAHRGVEDPVHEMLIVHRRETYVRPHKHLRKTESFHVVEGEGTIVLFDDAGRESGRIPLGDRGTGRAFYYRLAEPVFHTLIVGSDVMVFHEVAPGPFRREDTVFPAWAPTDDDADGARAYMTRLREEGEAH